MRRFYVPREIAGDSIYITDAEQLHHLKDVLRLKVGDEVVAFDGKGNEYACVVGELQAKQAVLTVIARRPAETKALTIAVACAIPKKAGLDEVVDGLTQLGVDSIIPMETERVIIRLDEARRKARLERWRRIAGSAAQQSQRSTVPVVAPITGISEVISGSGDFDLRLIPTLSGVRRPISEVLGESRPRRVLVLIGPEGDFTDDEVELAGNAGFIPVSLGDSVLRVATAAIAVASYIRLSLSD